jgi:hypothetical protein
MNSPNENSRLSTILTGWQVTPNRDPAFRARVWARIEASKKLASWPGFVRAHPTAIAGTLALAMVAGAVVGREQARARAEMDRGQLASAYVKALDARSMTMP